MYTIKDRASVCMSVCLLSVRLAEIRKAVSELEEKLSHATLFIVSRIQCKGKWELPETLKTILQDDKSWLYYEYVEKLGQEFTKIKKVYLDYYLLLLAITLSSFDS